MRFFIEFQNDIVLFRKILKQVVALSFTCHAYLPPKNIGMIRSLSFANYLVTTDGGIISIDTTGTDQHFKVKYSYSY